VLLIVVSDILSVLCVCQASRLDCCCCVQMSAEPVLAFDKKPSILYWCFKKFYARFLLNRYVRPIIVSLWHLYSSRSFQL